jgi:eukaryotic-like serine/threonine-protein kinase
MMQPAERLTAALSDRYRIERELGAGGMATVYLAHDIKHDRNVAIKVLKPELGAILGVERFLAEIRVTANLQHPNVLPLFDSGAADDLLFYVMPYVEGESLRGRLDREKQLPIDDAIEIASAIARALDYAHAHGVIHRDLKPENILLQAGQPLLADFGIALAMSRAGGVRMTESGLSLGTPQYMSPEQAAADRVIDGRADIYALGAVTYEMLTGEPPHTGSTAQAIVARVMTELPRPVRASRTAVSEQAEHAVHKALAKMPADRWSTAKAFASALSGPETGRALARRPGTLFAKHPSVREAVAWAAAIAGCGSAVYLATRHEPPLQPIRFAVAMPDSAGVFPLASRPIALSNDGSQLAMQVTHRGTAVVFIRRVDDTVPRIVRGTEGVTDLGGFSPDGRWFLYAADTVLKKVPVEGGNAEIVVESGRAGRWSDHLDVVYSSAGNIWLSSEAGSRRRVSQLDTGRNIGAYDDPDPLPGGDFALVTIRNRKGDSSRIGVISLRDGRLVDLGIAGMNASYVSPGHIAFARGGGQLLTVPFSLRTRRVTGAASQLLDNVDQTLQGSLAYALSRNGTLAYTTGSGPASSAAIVRVSAEGREHWLSEAMPSFRTPRLSPDGRRVLAIFRQPGGGPPRRGLWMFDIAAATLSLLERDSVLAHGEWSADGSRAVYVRQESRDSEALLSRPWDASEPAKVLARGALGAFRSISLGPAHGLSAIEGPDGILIAPTDSLGTLGRSGAAPIHGSSPRISPSGRLLAYVSDETGRAEVYVLQIAGVRRRVTVSTGGGADPEWSHDGATLFYRSPTRVMSVRIASQPVLEAIHPDTLFWDNYFPGYDVFGNGDLLMVRPPEPSKIFVLINWPGLASRSTK